MAVVDDLLRNIAPKGEELTPSEVLRFCVYAADILNLGAEDITVDNIDQIVNLAHKLQQDAVRCLRGRHDYLSESKLLPYEVFTKGIQAIWSGMPRDKVEATTRLSHRSQVIFNAWWRKNHDNYDRTDLRGIYSGFLQRNVGHDA